MQHLMIDLETWATGADAVVRAVCAIIFNPETGQIGGQRVIDARPSIDNQVENGRKIDSATVTWWKKQGGLDRLLLPHCETAIECDRQGDIVAAIDNLIRYSLWDNQNNRMQADARVWSRGSFDMMILRSLASHLQQDDPDPSDPVLWRYWQERDVRTLDCLTPTVKSTRPHDPVADCEAQIQQVVNAYALRRI
jgi:exodeoxyribonuclease VIII